LKREGAHTKEKKMDQRTQLQQDRAVPQGWQAGSEMAQEDREVGPLRPFLYFTIAVHPQ